MLRKTETEPEPSAERRALMARVRQKDTEPEMIVRRLLYGLGYRYRLHRRNLPGTPDICFPGRKKAVFVHGCFWHRHPGCRRASTPKTRTSFWGEKFAQNVARDRRKLAELRRLGWETVVVWECQTADQSGIIGLLSDFLSHDADSGANRSPIPAETDH